MRRRNEKGAITLFVLIAGLSFIAFLTTMLAVAAVRRQAQIEATKQAKEIYSRGDANTIYEDYFVRDGAIPIYTPAQLNEMCTGHEVAINEENGKIYTFSSNSAYVLMNDLAFECEGIWSLPEFTGNGRLEWNGKTITIKDISRTNDNYIVYYRSVNNYAYALDPSGANRPVLPNGNMKVEKVIWNENEGTYIPVYTDVSQEHLNQVWYDYSKGEWANIRTTSTTEGTNNEAYWVWVPRFAYKVPERPTSSNSSGNPTIQIAFLTGTSNTPANANDIPAGESILIDTSNGVSIGDWVVHPAFNWGGVQLKGIWVAKFEASSNTPNANMGGGNTNNLYVNVKPNIENWGYISMQNIFEVCRKISNSNSGEVLEGASNVDPHLIKNTEWGAVAYLTQSKYAQMRTTGSNLPTGRTWNNPNQNALTGQAGATVRSARTTTTDTYNIGNGPKASTTGNVYGIYDMDGGASEYVAAYVATTGESGNYASVNTYLASIRDLASNPTTSKYVDVYSPGNPEGQSTAYRDLCNGNQKLVKWGDALYETSYAGNGGEYAWQGTYTYFSCGQSPVFLRGGSEYYSNSGVFGYNSATGEPANKVSFRPVFIGK